jgi:N6-L-threonylcarbamoyladenine synthase
MHLLALETTCDETAAAVVTDRLEVLASVVASQDELHRRFGGVVPEIASRAHVERILPVIDEALRRAGLTLADIDVVAVANTPGLAGSLLVGLVAAKTICVARQIPLVAINHLQAHVYACRLAAERDVFPCIGLIVSGGHTSLYRCRGPLEFDFLGGTIDDAAGEAFDKVAAMLGLPYPGGPSIQRAAEGGNPRAFAFPRAFLHDERLDFSFSGLKTAVRYAIEGKPGESVHKARGTEEVGGKAVGKTENTFPPTSAVAIAPFLVADLAASFQEAVVDCLLGKAMAALHRTGLRTLCVGGGVAANARFRQRLDEECKRRRIELHVAPLQLCTDNAVMGALAIERWKAGLVEPLDLDILPGVVRSPQT